MTNRSNQGIVFPTRLLVCPADFPMHGAEVRIDLGIALVPVTPAPSHEEARFGSLFPYGCAKSFRRSMKALGVLSSQSGLLALVLDHDEIPLCRLESLLTGRVGEMKSQIFASWGAELNLVRPAFPVEYLFDELGALCGVAISKKEDLLVFAGRNRQQEAGKEKGKDEFHIIGSERHGLPRCRSGQEDI